MNPKGLKALKFGPYPNFGSGPLRIIQTDRFRTLGSLNARKKTFINSIKTKDLFYFVTLNLSQFKTCHFLPYSLIFPRFIGRSKPHFRIKCE